MFPILNMKWKWLPGITLAAPSNFSLSLVATSWKMGNLRQQVRSVHDPDSPWHLHSVRIKFLTAWKNEMIHN